MSTRIVMATNYVGLSFFGIDTTTYFVLSKLAKFAGEYTGESYPSKKTLLASCGGLSERTVRRCLKKLIDKGIVSRQKSQNNELTGQKDFPIYQFPVTIYSATQLKAMDPDTRILFEWIKNSDNEFSLQLVAKKHKKKDEYVVSDVD